MLRFDIVFHLKPLFSYMVNKTYFVKFKSFHRKYLLYSREEIKLDLVLKRTVIKHKIVFRKQRSKIIRFMHPVSGKRFFWREV
jgi:hypothetical protein